MIVTIKAPLFLRFLISRVYHILLMCTTTQTYTRQWVIWHLLEHDLHHGGEISLILGMHGLAAIGL